MSTQTLEWMQSSLPEVLQAVARSLSLLNKKKPKGLGNGLLILPKKNLHDLPVLKEEILHENMDMIRAYPMHALA